VSVLEIGIYLCADNELTPDWYILIVILGVLVGLMSIYHDEVGQTLSSRALSSPLTPDCRMADACCQLDEEVSQPGCS
jgi:hypothetical protein